MKILVVKDIETAKTANDLRVRLVADSALLPSGKPFFVPDFATRFTGRIALALRMGRLGKHIAAKFAHRYFSTVAACCMVTPHEGQCNGMNAEEDARLLSFDGSVLLGDFLPYDGQSDLNVSLCNEKGQEGTWLLPKTAPIFHGLIEELSRYFTLKMGDLILCDSGKEVVDLNMGGEVHGSVCGEASLITRVR